MYIKNNYKIDKW